MAIKRFVCLANSFKEGGRCLAGIELDNENKPVFERNRPKWLRPVSNNEHGAVETALAAHLNILDIVEFDMLDFTSLNTYQNENVTFVPGSLRVIGQFQKSDLEQICDDRFLLFGNRGKAIHKDKINSLDHSLLLIKPKEFEVVERRYDDNEYPQQRLLFKFNEINYDLPITDPVFLRKFQADPSFVQDIEQIYVSMSVGVIHNDWYNKLVAGIISAD